MIWYLLYPYRGTTEVPTLALEHPLRRALTRYAEHVARHVSTTLVMSITLVALVVFPFPFLYSFDGYNGTSVLPGNNWKSVRMIEDAALVQPNAVVRSMWTYTFFDQALDHESLRRALPLHDRLLGLPEGCDIQQQDGSTGHDNYIIPDHLAANNRIETSVFGGEIISRPVAVHTPITYWNCSMKHVQKDKNLRRTVLRNAYENTRVVNTIFSTPEFRGRRLRSADALVSTVIHVPGAEVGVRWNNAVSDLVQNTADEWVSSPASYSAQESDMFEFQKTPLSRLDITLVWAAYSLTVIYFAVSLMRLKAVKSRAGLIITIILQTVLSMLSSLTMCSALEVDVSHIPRTIYPLVVIALTLENIFRLINTVLLTPAEARPSKRVGYAFGESAPTALMSIAHNMLALWISSQVFSPAVAALCQFIAFAMVFDAVYFSTFFLAVLSIDLRRLELSDALAKASYRNTKPSSVEIKSPVKWPDSMIQGKIALSTRVAATMVMLNLFAFVQHHLPGFGFWNMRCLRLMEAMTSASDLAISVSWVRMARWEKMPEAFSVIDPSMTRFVVQVMQPISFVPLECTRIRPVSWWPFSNVFWDFVDRHLAAFFIAVLAIVAFVRLLLKCLLKGETLYQEDEDGEDDRTLLSIHTFPADHGLDVMIMAATTDGKIVSAGLDRAIRVWDARIGSPSYSLSERERPRHSLFPVIALAIDHESKWLAILSPRRVMLWSLEFERWGSMAGISLKNPRPLKFFFGIGPVEGVPPVIAVQADGSLVEVWAGEKRAVGATVCNSPLVSVDMMICRDAEADSKEESVMIVAASQEGNVLYVTKDTDLQWRSQQLSLDGEDGPVHQVVLLPEIKAILAVRSRAVDLIDLGTLRSVHTFVTGSIQYRTLQCCHSPRRRHLCGTIGLASLALVYTDAESGDCVMQTYLPTKAGDSICFRSPMMLGFNTSEEHISECCGWSEAIETTKHVSNPGSWQALASGSIIGVRRRHSIEESGAAAGDSSRSARSSAAKISEGLGVLRLRLPRKDRQERGGGRVSWSKTFRGQPLKGVGRGSSQIWEAWAVSHIGRQEIYETRPLHIEEVDGSWLMISELGPVVRVGAASVAVGFGNIVKVVAVGVETFDQGKQAEEAEDGLGLLVVSGRRTRRTTLRVKEH